MTNHIVSDMATRIRNAIQVRQPSVKVYNTLLTNRIAQIMVQEGFIKAVNPVINNKKYSNYILLELKYNGKMGCLTHIKSISKPGVRIYSQANDLPKILGGLGIMIVSTSKGVITDKKAREFGIGGELICSIW